jgi:ketosteroid isomerase-like protein
VSREFFASYYATYNRVDPEALGRFYAEDVVLTSAQGEVRGREALLGTYRYITSLFSDQMTPETMIVDGDRAAIEITDRFVALAEVPEFLGRPWKKGETYTLKLCAVYTLKNGQIARIVIYTR